MIQIMNSHNMCVVYIIGKFKGMLFSAKMHKGIKAMCLNTFKTTVRNSLCNFSFTKLPQTEISSMLGVQHLFL
jgi:hypothetical protein